MQRPALCVLYTTLNPPLTDDLCLCISIVIRQRRRVCLDSWKRGVLNVGLCVFDAESEI
jgi:hypothetical protein